VLGVEYRGKTNKAFCFFFLSTLGTQPSSLLLRHPVLCSDSSCFLVYLGAQAPHDFLDRLVDVREKLFPSTAKVIQSRLALRRLDEPVLRAFAEAGKLVFAPPAMAGKQSFLGLAEALLKSGEDHLFERPFHDVASTVFRVDVVVASIDRTIAFQGQPLSAHRRLGAERGDVAHPDFDSGLEIIDVDLPEVFSVPLVEDTAEKAPPVFGVNAPVFDDRARGSGTGLGIAEHGHEPLVPALRRNLPEPHGLHDRDELHPLRADLVAQKAIDLEGLFCSPKVHTTESCKIDLVFSENLCSPEHPVEASVAGTVFAVGIMQVPGTVNGETNKEVFLMQELAPRTVEDRTVGLHVIFTPHMGWTVLFLKLDNLPEEVQTEERRLAALPGEDHLLVVLALEVLPDEGLEHLVGNAPLLGLPEQLLLGEVVAVSTVEVAERPGGFHHHVHTPHGLTSIEPYPARYRTIRHATN
jgi:hypothetical protein